MTEITNKPVPRTPVVIDWAEDAGFEVRLEVRPDFAPRPFTAPPALSSHDTGYFQNPPQF